jgi:three-Cys-motif partner protein
MHDQTATVFPPKKIATKVKHHILQSCLKAWGGIIIGSNKGRAVHLAFVDTCCGSGLYEASDDAASDTDYDPGSAIIGLDTLNGLLAYGKSRDATVDAKALFINENASELATLRSAIGASGENAIPYKTLPHELGAVIDEVAAFCEKHFSFLLIDPYGPSAIPFSVVSRLVSLNRADCLINFPYYSVHKWVGWLDTESSDGATRLAIVDGLMNGQQWRDIARKHRHDTRGLENVLLDHYMTQLSKRGVAVIAIPMTFETKNRTMYYLVFTSKSTAGLASAKKQLQQGEHYQAALKAQLKASRQNQGMFDFMGVKSSAEDPVDIDALADAIKGSFAGHTVTRDDVIRLGIMHPNVLDSHVSKAITKLKQAGLARPSGASYKDTIEFS